MLDENIKKSIEGSVLCWLATVTSAGIPNVSPKEMFIHYGDDAVLIANIASPKSVANIKDNPSVCVSFIDVFKQKGFKLTGKATIVESTDADFESMLNELHKLGGENFPVRSIIKVIVEEAEPIIAPSYWLFPETTEQSQIEQAMETYGVCPKVRSA
ncbi:MAG: flavin-nucleotide-binding protein [gamma proteobacterium symbiont of Ctena orbiculata]|uniref:Pyridoxamine 5'-phosphate oxidase family protein n=1 Tax=Candidatus Thiodiazotropha taylori TaxID=2792791 RepID=A0A944M907_9GAMM|nr:pyridoxamine 5'-phosphate oxidase family protein [Candidatus Thiodiazotropha taylori]PUB88737.1 MAG: flavin-nucleotide-binding protein [gamma proteobacterium symbiont of Ctena orbiculata]MBT2989305.1 pyridoxamine 5'-phosphate oxidase family protein [Candidatus Thiodiazotropha taylori]MBT2996885.1 pyridoxamine 5'-phosphate oxidase family protein [Candidatus Thiodiazotropha taylori]MBT3000740.1 pyridoxamine 5'-phosphate oxidase family protein [Candidatus Thiodiazotropha taylori]